MPRIFPRFLDDPTLSGVGEPRERLLESGIGERLGRGGKEIVMFVLCVVGHRVKNSKAATEGTRKKHG
jgi:hypothetical protein